MSNERKVAALKRVLRVLSKLSGQQLTGVDFYQDDMVVLEELITMLGGDTRSMPHDIGTDNARQSAFMHKHQDEPNFDGPEEGDD